MRYGRRFYSTRHENTFTAARRILAALNHYVPAPLSVVDVGCGVGTWLEVARENGAQRVQGFDGPWVSREHLRIEGREFTAVDFARLPVVSERFDLVISLEVAEHLPAEQAHNFVDFLTSLGDLVLFGAAVPGQGGVGHVNEQWPDYWAALFRDRSFACIDVIRPAVWQDDSIPFWYRQNTLIYLKEGDNRWKAELQHARCTPLSLVHPELLRMSLRFNVEHWLSRLGASLRRMFLP